MLRFKSKPITTEDFASLPSLTMYAREHEPRQKSEDKLNHYFADFFGSFKRDANALYEMLITADDYYKLYINGVYVGQGPRPAYTSRYNYNNYDITKYLHEGENDIRVRVYYQGLINRVWVSGDNRMMLLADIFCDKKHIAGTEIFTECKKIQGYIPGDFNGHKTQFAEHFDFNLGTENKKICQCEHPYTFYDMPSPALETEYIKPKLIKIGENEYFADMGREAVGSVMLNVKGEQGQTVGIFQGEELLENGDVRYRTRCNCNYETSLILSGNDDNYGEYDYKGFRYIKISSDKPFIINNFGIQLRHHPYKQIINIKTDNDDLRKIWDLCADTAKYATQELFLDCPTREKGEYFGDITISALAHLYLTGDKEMYKRTLYDFADTSLVNEGLMAVGSSSCMQEIADFSLLLPMQIWNYYNYTGDKETVRELLPTAANMLKYFMRFARADGLLQDMTEKWNLVDWPRTLRDNYDAPTDNQNGICHNVINAYYIGAHIYYDKLCDAVGFEKMGLADELINAFNKNFLNKETLLYTDQNESKHSALHSNALPLCFGIVPEEAKENVIKHIEQKGLSCGVYFSYFVLKGLCEAGRKDTAMKLILDERYWLNMIKEGATTTFEAWGKEQKVNCSLCHPWASAPTVIIVEYFNDVVNKETGDS